MELKFFLQQMPYLILQILHLPHHQWMDIYISNVSGKDVVNYRDKDSTITLGEFDSCEILYTPIELDKSLSFTITTSIKDENFSVDSGIVPINLLIQKNPEIIDNTDIEDGVALKIVNLSPTPISNETLTFSPSNPTNGKVDEAYSGYSLSADGGTTPYTYLVSEGSRLPYGMILSSAGILSGTPIEPGTFTVGVKVFDNSIPPKSATNFFDIVIENNVAVDSNAPIASKVTITGPESIGLDRTSAKGSMLTGSYDYYDAEKEAEHDSGSEYKWYRSTNSNGTGLTLITGATTKTYTPVEEDVNKYIYFMVRPRSTDIAEGYGTSVFCVFPVKIMSGGANSKPVASDVIISVSGNTLTGSYTYSDAEGDTEGYSIFKWYYSNHADGKDKTQITGINSKSFTVPEKTYKNKYIFFEVTPKALTGTTQGDPVINSNVYYIK